MPDDISQLIKGAQRVVPYRRQIPDIQYIRDFGMAAGSNTWPVANDAIYTPFEIEVSSTLTQIHVHIVTQSGNIDVGIYPGDGGAKLVTMGATAMAVAGLQTFNIVDTVLPRGRYLAAVAVDNTTAALWSYLPSMAQPGQWSTSMGYKKQATSYPLPASATLASPTSSLSPIIILEFN